MLRLPIFNKNAVVASSSAIIIPSSSSVLRFCSASSSSSSSSSETTTMSSSAPPPPDSGMKMTNLAESLWLEQQNPNELDGMWCSVPTLYRRLIKLFIRKFPDHPDVCVRAWKQAKFEFYHFKDAPVEDVPTLVNRGRSIYQTVLGGIIPVVQDPKTKLAYCKYDYDTLIAAGGHIDPISAEEFMRRNKDKMSEAERNNLRDKLRESGRWRGPEEFSDKDVPKLKVKRKTKCTDPDPEE